MTNKPVLIAVAPNGARRTRRDHPALPLAPDEIAADALACAEAGASLLHLHVRDEAGGHSLAPDRYRRAIDAVRARCGERLLIQITTEACGLFPLEAQIAAVRGTRPEAASFALREFLPERGDESRAADFFAWVKDAGIIPQFILYAPGEADRLKALIARGIVPFAAPHVLFVLGRHAGGPPSDPWALPDFATRWSGPWSVCAFGPVEIRVAAAALALGGHVRIGFENNLQAPDGAPLRSNAEQVARVAALAALLGRERMTAAAARALGAGTDNG
ncbi:MAG TPA: 3-keto-5-aminohexanoate cleavage protein [Sphingomonadaceae bacterium]|nr:3-keto-5-aminohexanoate cleavage protein [Sphingomonadaceae bacterium]